MTTITVAHNAVNAKVLNAPKDVKLEIHRLLSYAVEGSEHMSAFKSGSWDGRSSFFSFDKETFPTGFVRLVTQGIRKMGHQVQVVSKEIPAPQGPERPEVDAFGYTERYDYQPQTIDALVRHKNITVQVATGGGKSRIARMAMKRIDRPTLFLTTRGILMHQMLKAVQEMTGEPVAVLGDGEWGIPYVKPDGKPGRRLSKFVVGMVQTLAQRLEPMNVRDEMTALEERRQVKTAKAIDELRKKLVKERAPAVEMGGQLLKLAAEIEAKQTPLEQERPKIEAKVARHEHLRQVTAKVLERFELVIVEEAHEVSGNGFYTVMSACKNAHYRMALTATPFMKDDEAANMRLLASCGPVAVQITEKLLIDRGILAKPYFKYLQMPVMSKPKRLARSTPWQRAYEVGIVENEYRNKAITAELLRAKKFGLNAMVLVQHRAHGEILLELFTRTGLRAEFIYGEDNQDARSRALQKLGSGAIDVLIGSTILDVGVDVPSVGVIVLAGGGKAEVATRQRIGRGLREKKSGPNVAFIIDVADDHNNHLKGHYMQRRSIVEGTPGFAENIVRDFDYAGLGLTRLVA